MSISKRVRRAGRGGVWTMTLLTAALSAWSCQPVGEPPEAVEAVLTPPPASTAADHAP